MQEKFHNSEHTFPMNLHQKTHRRLNVANSINQSINKAYAS
jgi:hypothetical protein